MRTPLTICTEADYLQAHLTFLGGEPALRNLALQKIKQRVTSVVKKRILAGTANRTPPCATPSKPA